jgi:hypothetical protein
MNTSIRNELRINQYAQGLIPIEDMTSEFVTMGDGDQIKILKMIIYFIVQQGVMGIDGTEAVNRSGLKPTFTPCRMLLLAAEKAPYTTSFIMQKITAIEHLPNDERRKSFILLMNLFKIVYDRRYQNDFDPHRHWWQRDLSDPDIVKDILKPYRVSCDMPLNSRQPRGQDES